MKKLKEATFSRRRHRRQEILARSLSLILCLALFITSTGMSLIGEDGRAIGSDPPDASVSSEVVPGDSGDDAGTGDGELPPEIPGDGSGDITEPGGESGGDGSGDVQPNPGDNSGDGSGGGSEGDTGPVEPDPDLDPDLDAAAREQALERFLNGYNQFVADYDYECANHDADPGHTCRFAAFEDAMNAVQNTKMLAVDIIADDVSVQNAVADMDAKLSEIAVSAFLARAEAILNSEYAGMTEFDDDVTRANRVLRYALDYDLSSNVVQSMKADLEAMRLELAEALEKPPEPEMPDTPDVKQPILDAYTALNNNAGSMSFDAIVAECERIRAMIAEAIAGGYDDSVDNALGTVLEYMAMLKSNYAVAEMSKRVSSIEAAEPKTDALIPEIDAAKALAAHMRTSELESQTVRDYLARLDAVLAVINAPVVTLSPDGEKLVEDINAFDAAFDAERLHQMAKSAGALRERFNALIDTDKTHESMLAALEKLSARESVCNTLDANIKAFLDACDVMFELMLQPGFDVNSEAVINAAGSIVASFNNLDEAALSNIEVAEAWAKLDAAGLIPGDDISEVLFFEVKLDVDSMMRCIEAKGTGAADLNNTNVTVFNASFDVSTNWVSAGAGIGGVYNDYFRSYAVMGANIVDQTGRVINNLPLDIAHTGGHNLQDSEFVHEHYASTLTFDEINIKLDDLATWTSDAGVQPEKTMQSILDEFFVEVDVHNGEAYPVGTQCFVVAFDIDSSQQNTNVAAEIDLSLKIGGQGWGDLDYGSRVEYRFRALAEPGDRDIETGDFIYNNAGIAAGDGLFIADESLADNVGGFVARRAAGMLLDENGEPMEGLEVALFSYDAKTDAYTRLERDIAGVRYDRVYTDVNGEWAFEYLPAGAYYIAMSGEALNNKAAGESMLKVTDKMHGLTGWSFVSRASLAYYTLQEFERAWAANPVGFEACQSLSYTGAFEEGLPPYEIFVTWMDGQAGATLSEDKKHADWVVDSAEDSKAVGKGFQVELVMHEDIPAGTDLFFMPQTLAEVRIQDDKGVVDAYKDISTRKGQWVFQFRVDATELYAALSDVSLRSRSIDGVVTVFSDDVLYSGSRIQISFTDAIMYRVSEEGSTSASTANCSVEFLGEQSYQFESCAGAVESLTFTRTASVESVSVVPYRSDEAGTRRAVSKNLGYRVWSWSPSIEAGYGVSKSQFDDLIAQGKALVEFEYAVEAVSGQHGLVSLDATSTNGEPVSITTSALWHRGRSLFSSDVGFTPSSANTDVTRVWPWPNYAMLYNKFGDMYTTGYTTGSYYRFGNTYVAGLGNDWADMFVGVLVAYDADSLVDTSTSTITTDCTLHAVFHDMLGNGIAESSLLLSRTVPYIQIESEGNMYSLNIDTVSSNGCNRLLVGRPAVLSIISTATYKMPSSVAMNNVSVGMPFVGLTGAASASAILSADDFCISKVSVLAQCGDAYFDDAGGLIDVVQNDSILDDALQIFVCRADNPNEWVLDSEIPLRSFSDKFFDVVLHCDDAVRVQVVYPDRTTFVKLRLSVQYILRSDSPTILSIFETVREHGGSLAATPIVVSTSYGDDGQLFISKPVTDYSGHFADEIHELSALLYSSQGYTSDAYPMYAARSYNTLGAPFSSTVALIGRLSSDKSQLSTNVAGLVWDSTKFGETETLSSCDFTDIHRSRFYVIVPDTVDVTAIYPDFVNNDGKLLSDNGYALNCYTGLSGAVSMRPVSYVIGHSPVIEFSEIENAGISGHAVYCVDSDIRFDRASGTIGGFNPYAMVSPYAAFTVQVRPKYTDKLTTADTAIYVVGYLMRDDGTAYKDQLIVKMQPDGGWNYVPLPDDAGLNFLWDLDRNGVTNENIILRGAQTVTISGSAAYTSGLQLAAQSSGGNLYSTSATTYPGDEYKYRLQYSQAIEPSTNVVMFNSLEAMDGNTWSGVLKSIDMSDAERQNIPYKIYGNLNRIDSLNYVQTDFSHVNLRNLEDGWFEITDATDLSTVKSVAIDFLDHEFQRQEDGKPAVVRAYLTMQAPGAGFAPGLTEISSRAFFCDTLKSSQVSRTVMANTVKVGVQVGNADVSADGLSKSVAYFQVDETDSDNMWVVTGDEIVPDSRAAVSNDSSQVDAQNKLTIDRVGKPVNALNYVYQLRYEMPDPGAGYSDRFENVILYDEIESGTDSKYAGALIDISAELLTAEVVHPSRSIDAPDDDIALYSALPNAPMRMRSYYWDDLDTTQGADAPILVFVGGDGWASVPSGLLPDGLVETTGTDAWMFLSPDAEIPDDVNRIAVVAPRMTSMHESGLGSTYEPSSLTVWLTMEHAGRTDCFGNSKIIHNGAKMAYRPLGTDEFLFIEKPDATEVEIIYRDASFVMPITGGGGWFLPALSGFGCLALAISWVLAELRRRKQRVAVAARADSDDGSGDSGGPSSEG